MKQIVTPWDDRALVAFSPPQRGEGGQRPDEGSFFTQNELATANAFKLASRREEWLHVRYVAKQLAMQFGLANDPRTIAVERPCLVIDGVETEWRVSLSHSEPYAAAAIARTPIGIDVERLRGLDERGAHLFLTPGEIEQLQRCTIANRVLHFWCAKEAAWKQRSGEFVTLRQVPLQLIEERDGALLFDVVETSAIDGAIAAITRPTF